MADRIQAHDVLFQLTGVGVVETDMATGRLVRANQTFCELLGYSEAELKTMTYLELTHPDDRARDAESFAALRRGDLQGGVSLTRVVRKDGETVWLELHITLLGEGDQVRNLTVTNDVTERRRANETLEQRVAERTEELRRSERRFSQAFYANPIPACMTTLGRETFVEVNDAFLQLTGYERDEVVGRMSRELEMWSSSEDQRRLNEAQEGGQGFRNLELRLRDKGGGVHTVLMSASVIRFDGDEGYLKMFYDITARKQTEEQLHRAIQEVVSDASWFSGKVMERLATIKTGEAGTTEHVELSKREREVLERLAGGMGNDDIASELGIAMQTVRNYISNIYDKIGVHSRVEAVIWARERGVGGG